MENNEIIKTFEEYFSIEKKLKELTDKKNELKDTLKKNIKNGESEFSLEGYKVQIRHSTTKTLKEDLVEKILKVKVTDECYKVTESDRCFVLKV